MQSNDALVYSLYLLIFRLNGDLSEPEVSKEP